MGTFNVYCTCTMYFVCSSDYTMRICSGPTVIDIFLFLPVSDPSPKSDDGVFDIITEEEVNGVYDSDNVSQTTGGSLEGDQEPRPPGALDM